MFCPKILVCAVAALVLAASPYLPDAQAATLALSGGKAVLQDKGASKPLPQEEFEVVKSQHSPFQFLTVGEEQSKKYGLPVGLYLFHKDGSPAGVIKHPAAEFCSEVYLSPDKKILLMDSGTWLVRDVFIYSYPDLQPVRAPGLPYFANEGSGPLWVGNDQFVYSTINTESGRACDYDPCGSVSARLFNVSSGEETVIKQGDDLCDYFALRADKDNVVIGSRCLPSAKDWRNYPETPLKESSVKLN